MQHTGYHYTSADCWQHIQVEGLVPYKLRRPMFKQILGTETIIGIWIWINRPVGLSHVGCIIYQMACKNTQDAVMLKVAYHHDNCLSPPGEPNKLITLPHTGTIENLEYHNGNDSAVIVTSVIKPKTITLIGEYNLLDAWRDK